MGAAETAEAGARHDDTAMMAREIARDAGQQCAKQAAHSDAMARAADRARGGRYRGQHAPAPRLGLGELSLSEWLLAERNGKQISRRRSWRADALSATRVVDGHELWHTVD